MKQLELFSPSGIRASYTLFIDGAARGNPGLAGAGVFLLHNEKPVFEYGYYLENKTNNQAEYMALLLGIYQAAQVLHPRDELIIKSDSQLLVCQMSGVYKISDAILKQYAQAAKQALAAYKVSFVHVRRELNKKADALANKGIDQRIPIPLQFFEYYTVLHSK